MRPYCIAVNDSLNRSRWKAGLPWQLWVACTVVSLAVLCIVNVIFGLILFVALPASFVLLFRKDERIVELACHASAMRSYYDPGKAKG